MAKIRVVRIEKDGLGPYHHAKDCEENPTGAFRAHYHGNCPLNTSAEHPEPSTDALLRHEYPYPGRDWVYGFRDEAQYFQWFYTESARLLLAEEGYELVEYFLEDGECVHHGSAQTIFKRDYATRGARLRPDAP